MAYKPDQGRYARLAVFWTLAILLFYGCTSLHQEVLLRFAALKAPLVASMPRVPVLGLALNGSMVITATVLGAALWVLWRWQSRPRVADLLIETESELRKVTWPSLPEAANSSIVVLICVAILMAYLAIADWVMGRWATLLLTGGAG